jgi:hypothetical protein
MVSILTRTSPSSHARQDPIRWALTSEVSKLELDARRIVGGKAGVNRDDSDDGRGSPAPSMGEALSGAAAR